MNFRGNGTFTVPAINYSGLAINGGAQSLAILGSAPGQSIQTADSFNIASPTTSNPYAPDILVGTSVGGRRWSGMSSAAYWTGSGDFDVEVYGTFSGSPQIPGADVTLHAGPAQSSFGQWWGSGGTYGSLTIDSAYVPEDTRTATGLTGRAPTPPGSADVAVASRPLGGHDTVLLYNMNGTDVGLTRTRPQGWPTQVMTLDADWDDADPNGVDDDGNAILTLPDSGGIARADGMVNGGCGSYIWGSIDDDFAVWALCNDGSLDPTFDGDGVLRYDAGGVDRAEFVQRNGNTLTVVGTGGASPAFRVVRFDMTTWTVSTNATWQAGGQPTEAFDACYHSDGLWLVGRTGTPGARDWVAHSFHLTLNTWHPTFSPYVHDAGGTEDVLTTCATADRGQTIVGGTSGDGISNTAHVRSLNGNATPSTLFQPASWGTGNTEVTDIMTRGQSVYVLGTDSANGGQVAFRRFDILGRLDPTFGTTNGVATYDGGPGAERGAMLSTDPWANYPEIAFTSPDDAGDMNVLRTDFNGTRLDNGPGRPRISISNRELTIAGDLRIGGGANDVVVDGDLEVSPIRVGGDLIVDGGSAFRPSAGRTVFVRGGVDADGLLDVSRGTLRIEGPGAPIELSLAAPSALQRLEVLTPGRRVRIDPTRPLRVTDTLRIRGSSCSAMATLESAIPSSPWTIDLTGATTVDVAHASITDSTAVGGTPTSTTGVDGGGNTGWTLSGCAAASSVAPDRLLVDGRRNPTDIDVESPVLSHRNLSGGNVDTADVEVYSSTPEDQLALWRFDGDGSDATGNGHTMVPAGVAGFAAGRFGQGADVDDGAGDQLAAPSNAAFDVPEFSVDAWIRSDGSATSGSQIIVERCAGSCQFRIRINNSTNELNAWMSNVADLTGPVPNVDDGNWHHVALTVSRAGASLYWDGRPVADWYHENVQAAVMPAAPIVIGRAFGGRIDDVRILGRAAPRLEIAGYYATGRRHVDRVWDFDPSDSTGTAIGSTVADGARFAVPYGGGPTSLRIEGARYWVRARTRLGAGSWSAWSAADWFQTSPALTVSIDDTTNTLDSAALPDQDVVGESTFTITTTARNGYTAHLAGPSDSWALGRGVNDPATQIAGWGSSATPSPWPAGTPGFGLSVTQAGGGKDASRWGTGTTKGDTTNLKYAWASASTPLLLHTNPAYDPNPQTLRLAYRVRVDASQDPGSYSSTMQLTLAANP